jgi:flagellar biosynthesis/type III secretory pathway chaperone
MTKDITDQQIKQELIGQYTTSGIFADEALPQIAQIIEKLRGMYYQVKEASALNGQGLRLIVAENQQTYDIAFERLKPILQEIVAFTQNDVPVIKQQLDALSQNTVVTQTIPAIIDDEE